jgi:hypothetical protein
VEADRGVSWRLAVLDGPEVVGAGFVISPDKALTCAHVVDGREQIRVQRFGERDAHPVFATDVGADIAVLELASSTVAPLGPLSAPAAGTVVSLLGLPRNRDAEGRWTEGVVMGPDRSGDLIQIDALNAHGAWVVPGFSGGAAVDRASGLVVGMVVRANRNPDVRNAWILPLSTLARYWPALQGGGLTADPAFRDFRTAFDTRRYADALTSLSAVQRRFPDEAEVYYYWALAALGGWRPAAHAGETVGVVLRLLSEADRRRPGMVHAGVLAALVCEDYFVLRRMPAPHLPMARTATPARLDAAHAREILDHVPAPDCATWRTINDRSRS